MKLSLPFQWQRTRKPDPFVMALLEQTQQLIYGAQAVIAYIETPSREHARAVYQIEHAADEVRRLLIVQLKRAFITPIDREDIFGLSRAIDDVLDYLLSLVREMHVLKVPPNAYLKSMVVTLAQCADSLHNAVLHLEHQPDAAIQHSIRVRQLENHIDGLYIRALDELFQHVDTPDDMINVLKLREIYRHVIHAANSAEQAANLINDVLVKLR